MTTPTPQPQGYNLTPQSLVGQTITPNQSTDRYGIAQQQFQNFADQSNPAYASALKQATSAGAGAGQLGSGQLRTSYGNLANQRNQQLQQAQTGFLTDALNGSIQDAYNNVGIAQQQQQYQAGQNQQNFGNNLATVQQNQANQGQAFNQNLAQQQLGLYGQNQGFQQGLARDQYNLYGQNQSFNQNLAQGQFQDQHQNQLFNQGLNSAQLGLTTQAQQFGQGVTTAQLGDQLTNSAYNRNLGLAQFGSSGNPTDTQLALSQLRGTQAGQAGSALSGQIGNTISNNANQEYLRQIQAQYGGGGLQPTPTYSGGPATTPTQSTGGALNNPNSYITPWTPTPLSY